MPTDKKYVASYLVDTGASTQNIQAVQDALVQSGNAGISSASRITQGLEAIETNSDKAMGKIANGAQVSDSALTQLAARYVALQQAVTDAFGSIENAPQAIQDAMRVAEEQVQGVNTAVVSMGDRVTLAAERFRELATSGGDAAKTVAEGADAASGALDTVGTSATAAGTAVTEGADAASEALDTESESATRAAEAIDGMAAASARAALPLPDVTRGVVSVDIAAQHMADTVAHAWQVDEEGGRLSARQLTVVVENRVRLRQAIIDEFGSLEEADAATRATYEAWDAEVQRLIQHTQELMVAQRQATVALKEGGEQFATIGLMAQQAGRLFGETGQKIGSAAGELGLMGAMSAHLQKNFEGLKLNELQGGFARTAIQAALVTAAFLASSAAGLKLAEANAENAESFDNLVKSMEGAFQTDFMPWFGRIEAAAQVFIADMMNATTASMHFWEAISSGDKDAAIAALDQASKSFNGLAFETMNAMSAQDRRAQSTNKAATADEIAAKFAKENADMARMVATATDAARAAVEKRTAATKDGAAADEEATKGATADAHEQADAAEALAKVATDLAKAKEVEAKNATLVVAAMKEEAKAKNDDSDATKQSIKLAEDQAKAKGQLATAAKLAADALKEAAAQAKEDARQEDEDAKSAAHLTDMLQSLTDAVNQETGAYAKKETAIQKQIDKLQEELKTNDDLSDSDKARIQQMITVAARIDQLQQAEDKLTAAKKQEAEATTAQTSATAKRSAATKSEEALLEEEIAKTGSLTIAQNRLAQSESQIIVVKSGVAAQVEADIAQQRRLLNSLNDQAKATDDVSTATSKNAITQDAVTGAITNVTKASDDASNAADSSSVQYDKATHSMTNVKEAADKAADSTTKAGNAAQESDPFWQKFNDFMAKAGITVIPQFSMSMDVSGKKIVEVTPQVAAHVLEVDKLSTSYKGAGDAIKDNLLVQLAEVDKQLAAAKTNADALVAALNKIPDAVNNIPSGGPPSGAPITPPPGAHLPN
ncbi:MAG TPA: hypothetical protein VLC46_16415 [Thermoanaerobaculia bacterium]|jgi:hypothetical protein|nr:hypothetical protein [Thermoanaerobaculia bacterium]